MLSLNNISFFFGSRALYENASLHIKPGVKMGLVGANGTGKSTLLKIITGEYAPDEGSVSRSRDCTIAFLNQDQLSFQSKDSILEVAMEAFEKENQLLARINDTLHKLETAYEDKLVERLTSLQEEFDALGGYSIQARAEEILEGLGFTTDQLSKPLEQFSGGWRMRVILAKMLLAKPSLLLLDEPTNHLDLPAIEWLEDYMNKYEGAVMVVSHDREFLDKTCKTIAEVANEEISLYTGNYTHYLKEKEERDEIQRNAFKNQQQHIKQTEKFIERFKAKATKARQVQSRVKALEKLERIDDVQESNAAISFKFNFNRPSGKIVMELKGLSKSYGELKILENTDAVIRRGDKIALIGANGKGKSTLLRILFGSEQIDGTREEGYNVETAFYAQHQLEALSPTNSMLQELIQSGVEKTELELRNILGCFLFSDEDVQKKVKVLSGGERSRVAMAKTLISEANFLLLDEPTNHLDMVSTDMVAQALDQYEGSFVVVSHNREFISRIANKIWYIEDHQLKEYPGTYSEYDYWRKNVKKQSATSSQQKKKKESQPKSNKKEFTPNTDHELKQSRRELDKIEKAIEEQEKNKSVLEEEMSQTHVYSNVDLLAEKSKELEGIESELQTLHNKWEEVAETIDTLENE